MNESQNFDFSVPLFMYVYVFWCLVSYEIPLYLKAIFFKVWLKYYLISEGIWKVQVRITHFFTFQWLPLPEIFAFVKSPPLQCGLDLRTYFKWTDHNRSDGMSLLRFRLQKYYAFCFASNALALSQSSDSGGSKVPCCENPFGESKGRNWCLQPSACEDSTACRAHTLVSWEVAPPQFSLQETAALAHTFIAGFWEPLGQKSQLSHA